MNLGTLTLSQAVHPAFRGMQILPTVHREEKAVLPTGNHIGFMVDEQRIVTTQKTATENVSVEAASESVKWILDHPSAESFTDAVHEQLLKSFLLDNGLAVTSSTDEEATDQARTSTPETELVPA